MKHMIKTEYAGKPKGCIHSKTEPETVNGTGVERRKETYTAYHKVKSLSGILCFCGIMTSEMSASAETFS